MLTATDFMNFQSDAIKAGNALAAKSLEGMQKLADLNMQTLKSTLDTSAEQVKSLMAVKDAKALNETLVALAQPNAEQATAYAKDVYAIASETNAEVVKLFEQQVEEGNKQLMAAVDALAKNAPAGSESAISFMKQSLITARTAYDQAAKAGKQVVEMAEANVANVTKAAAPAKKR